MTTEATSPARPKQTSVRGLVSSPLADYYLIIFSVIILCGIGSLMVLSASSVLAQAAGESPYYYAIRQLVFLAAGVAGGFVVSRMKPQLLRSLGWVGWAVAIILLMLVLSPLGHHYGGNTNWLQVGPVTFQPSEFSKFALVIWAAAVYHAKRGRLHEPFQLFIPFVPGAALLAALVLAGRDLGTGIVIGMMIMALLYFVGAPFRVLVPLGLVATGFVFFLAFGSGNRMSRIQVFMDPQSNPDLSSQPMAAVHALASGGWWGAGLGAGRQKWGGLKDAAHTDFIFAVIGEELGLFGVLLVIAMFALLARCGLSVALRSDKMFNRIAAAGVTTWFIVQGLINIMVVMHMLPVLGVPLPFVSSGGSALVASLLGVGTLLACARDTPQARRYLASRKPSSRPRMTSVMAVGR